MERHRKNNLCSKLIRKIATNLSNYLRKMADNIDSIASPDAGVDTVLIFWRLNHAFSLLTGTLAALKEMAHVFHTEEINSYEKWKKHIAQNEEVCADPNLLSRISAYNLPFASIVRLKYEYDTATVLVGRDVQKKGPWNGFGVVQVAGLFSPSAIHTLLNETVRISFVGKEGVEQWTIPAYKLTRWNGSDPPTAHEIMKSVMIRNKRMRKPFTPGQYGNVSEF